MQHALSAYTNTAKKTVTPRELEADLLLKAAAKLQAVKEGWPETKGTLFEALNYNRKLWTILATSATSKENPLPQEIKNNIGSLAVFIFGRIFDVEFERDPKKLDALIKINREIAQGLSAMPSVSSPSTAPEQKDMQAQEGDAAKTQTNPTETQKTT